MRCRRVHRGVAAACLCALAGCATDQRADVDAYRSISDPPGVRTAFDPGAPLSLLDALRYTAEHNELLAAQGESYVQALADRQRAAAALLPTFDLFTDVTLRENTGSDGVVQTDLGVTGQYRVLTGQSDLRAVDAADAVARARRWLILDLRETLLLQTSRAYYETLRAERLTAVLESSVQAQLARFEDARARNEVGLTRPLDVAQIEAQVSRTRTQLISARSQAREARAVLALLTNVELGDSELIDGFNPPLETPDFAGLVTTAREFRQDLRAAREEANAARLLVDAAIGQYAPSISLNLDYFLARAPDDSGAIIASLIQLRAPIFSAGRIEADVRAAWSVFRQRVLEFRLLEREARRDVEIAAHQLSASRARAAELSNQVTVARQTLLLAEASYQAGLGTNLERVRAQDELLLAELEATSEEFVTKAATLALRRACGLLMQDQFGVPWPEPSEPRAEIPDSPFLDRRGPVGPPASAERES